MNRQIAIFLMVNVAIINEGKCSKIIGKKLEKPLFIPSPNYPTLVHLHPPGYSTDLLENAASFPRYAHNHDGQEFVESLEKQILFQSAGKRLEAIFHAGNGEKKTEIVPPRENENDHVANSILYQVEPELEYPDLDHRYKRDSMLSARSPVSRPIYVFNNQQTDLSPFGLIRPTTWNVYKGRLETSPMSSRTRPATIANQPRQTQRIKRKIPPSDEDDSVFKPNMIRTQQPLQTPEYSKPFPEYSFFIPIQTGPLIWSGSKSEEAHQVNSVDTKNLFTHMRNME